jgi:hypothetical protein
VAGPAPRAFGRPATGGLREGRTGAKSQVWPPVRWGSGQVNRLPVAPLHLLGGTPTTSAQGLHLPVGGGTPPAGLDAPQGRTPRSTGGGLASPIAVYLPQNRLYVL